MTPGGRICQLLHSLHVGGAEVLAARLARQLRPRFRFSFVCLDDPLSSGPLDEPVSTPLIGKGGLLGSAVGPGGVVNVPPALVARTQH